MPSDPNLFILTVGLIGTVIVISALLSGWIEKSGLPQVAIFLGLGALIGPAGLNFVDADVHSPILRGVATICLVLVLFTDAVSLNIAELRAHKALALLMLGPGTLLSMLLMALMGWIWLGLNPAAAVILGAALASTDPVLLRGLLRRPEVNSRVRQALRLEGGMNDAVLLPVVLVGISIWTLGRPLTLPEWGHLALNILVLSPGAGVLIALASVSLLELVRKHSGMRRDYESIYSLGVAFAAFAAAEAVHGSGFLAAFAAGLTISALDVELCDCFLEYGETTAEMALMFAFVLFGTSLIWTGASIAGPATLLFTLGVFLSRFAAFVPALIPIPMPWKHRFLIGWFGPRGLSSLLLILLPVVAGIPGSEELVRVCCLIVLFSVVLHGLSPNLIFRGRSKGPEPASPAPSVTGLPGLPELVSDVGPGTADSEALPAAPVDPEYITIDEVKSRGGAAGGVLIIDARTERTYEESTENVPGAVRLHPDDPVTQARKHELPRGAVLAVLCA